MPSAFATSVDQFLAEFFRLLPVHATSAGNHDHDGRWPDLTDAGRAERLAFLDRSEETFGRFADADLAVDERIDRDLLLGEIAAARFEETELATERWSVAVGQRLEGWAVVHDQSRVRLVNGSDFYPSK